MSARAKDPSPRHPPAPVTPTDPAGELLQVPTGGVHVVVEGPAEGPVCLLSHGAPGSLRDFRYLAPALADRGLRAVRVDMPGFGETPLSVWPDLSPKGRAAFLRNIGKRFARRFAVVGHSIAGPPCLVAAGLYPDEVAALVLINSVGVQRHRGMGIPEVAALALEGALSLPEVSGSLASLLRDAFGRRGFRPEDVEALDVEQLRMHMRLVGTLDFKLFRAAARQVRCPSLVVSSEDDPLIEPRVSHGLADALAGERAQARHLHLAAGGHYLQKHAARDIAQQLAEMLRP